MGGSKIKSRKPEKISVLIENTLPFQEISSYPHLFASPEPRSAINTGKVMAKAWIEKQHHENRLGLAQNFLITLLEKYWTLVHINNKKNRKIPRLFKNVPYYQLDNATISVAHALGSAASELPVVEATYLISTIYTALLPEDIRSSNGVFYTPPCVVEQLLDMCENAGIEWNKHSVLDPACGGGAFIIPVCIRIINSTPELNSEKQLEHIFAHLKGWELDPFSGWMTQTFIEIVLKDIIDQSSSYAIHPIIDIRNSLEIDKSHHLSFDLIIGNPPYGKLKQTPEIKSRFGESLFGHPNLYGLFTQLAIELSKPKGIIAYVTPTSWLSGEYFKKLREYVRNNSKPLESSFITSRKGVFDDALQETMLFILRKGVYSNFNIKVNELDVKSFSEINKRRIGEFKLPEDIQAPWILPRNYSQKKVALAMTRMTQKLSCLGYSVSTGPLVWNRHKEQFAETKNGRNIPVIWAESITPDGQFILKAEKNNHKPYFKLSSKDNWLVIKKPCILLQRTTAKEQEKRLIAALLPKDLYKNGVTVENHLNMILPTGNKPKISAEVLTVLLNSNVVNQAFKCISGSVAVSAYELESMPLPPLEKISYIETLLKSGVSSEEIDNACNKLY